MSSPLRGGDPHRVSTGPDGEVEVAVKVRPAL